MCGQESTCSLTVASGGHCMNPPGEESGVPHGCCAWSPGTVQPQESWPFQQLLIRVRYTGCRQITCKSVTSLSPDRKAQLRARGRADPSSETLASSRRRGPGGRARRWSVCPASSGIPHRSHPEGSDVLLALWVGGHLNG